MWDFARMKASGPRTHAISVVSEPCVTLGIFRHETAECWTLPLSAVIVVPLSAIAIFARHGRCHPPQNNPRYSLGNIVPASRQGRSVRNIIDIDVLLQK